MDKKVYMKQYRKDNAETIRENKRLWRKNNPEKVKVMKIRYKQKSPDKVKESNKKYYRENSKKILARCKLWAINNIEKYKERRSKYYLKHRDKAIKRTKLWQKQNPERANEKSRNWAKAHPEQRKLASLRRRVRDMEAEGNFTLGEWKLLKEQYGFRCPCCGRSEPEIKLTIDHIIPLIKGGTNYIENIQPLCQSCNSSKHTTIIKYINYE